MAVYEPGSGSSPDTVNVFGKLCRYLVLDFPISGTVKNKFLLFMSCVSALMSTLQGRSPPASGGGPICQQQGPALGPDTVLFPRVGVRASGSRLITLDPFLPEQGALCSYWNSYLFGCEFAFPALNASAGTSIHGSTEHTLSSLTQQ